MKILVAIFLILLSQTNALFDTEIWETNEVDLNDGGDTIFYYLFKARDESVRNKRLMIWLNGGPGCSSITGLIMENGPYIYDDNVNLIFNEYSWNNITDIVFIDQPFGTGFANVKDSNQYCRNETCVATNFYRFFLRFLELYHPEYIGVPLYIFGESYGGHYVPSISEYLIKSGNPMIKLMGVGVGNGVTSIGTQLLGYPLFLYENHLINALSYFLSQILSNICNIAIYFDSPSKIFCSSLLDWFPIFTGIINVYDIRANATYENKMNASLKLINDPETQKIFGIKKYKEIKSVCDPIVYAYMIPDLYTSYASSIATILDSQVKFMLYYGDKDYICNWRGGEYLAKSINWKHQDDFNAQTYSKLDLEGDVIGEYKKYEQFTFLRVYDAGHMVPMNQQKGSLKMIDWFFSKA